MLALKLEEHLQFLMEEMIGEARSASFFRWLRLASLKMELLDSSISESDWSAQALPWMVIVPPPPEDATAAPTMRPPTWQQYQEMEKYMDCLRQQITDITTDLMFAEDALLSLTGGAEAACEEFVRMAKARRGALLLEWRRLGSLKTFPDLSVMTESDRVAEVEKLQQEKLDKARRLREQGDIRGCLVQEAFARIVDFDAKQLGIYYTSVCSVDLTTFDHTEESPIGPMRFTDRAFEDKLFEDYAAINILSVKIACLDIGFPIQVYGTVAARDCIDYKRVYLFKRDSDHCQLINSEEEALILAGPKRGLALPYRDDYVETDLWVKDCQGHCRQFSKGIVIIPGTATQCLDNCEAERVSLATRLSTVDDVVKCAVEATIAVEVIQGGFDGVVAAHTTSSKRRIVLYDSNMAGGDGVIQLMRSAVSVYVMDKLIISAKTTAGSGKGLKFTPYWDGRIEAVLVLSDVTMRVKVAWSMMK